MRCDDVGIRFCCAKADQARSLQPRQNVFEVAERESSRRALQSRYFAALEIAGICA
jgi:hypothetical protein